MNLTSHAFFLLFLPISLLFYWRFFKSSQSRLWVLLALSYGFYALADWKYIPLLLGLSWITFQTARRGWFTTGIVINLAGLAFFKLIGWESAVLNGLGFPVGDVLLNLALPLGLSYYTFKHISYLLDIKWRVYPASADFTVFAAYAAFFPQISAGPLSSFQDTGKQLRALPERLSNDQVFDSLVYITIGLSKKLLIANILLKFAETNSRLPLVAESGLISAWLLVLASALGIYFDFSGYTDMVIGLAQLFGIRLPPNFNNPFLAKDIQDFWNRWHISLSKWFRVYVFFPLSRKFLTKLGTENKGFSQSTANLITMFLVGLWHGITFGNLAWGVLMGLLLNLQGGLKRRKKQIRSEFLARLVLLLFIFVGLAVFISPDFEYARLLLGKLSGLGGFEGWSFLTMSGNEQFYATLLIAVVIAFSGFVEADKLLRTRTRWFATAMGILLALCLLSMGQPVDFVYVQF